MLLLGIITLLYYCMWRTLPVSIPLVVRSEHLITARVGGGVGGAGGEGALVTYYNNIIISYSYVCNNGRYVAIL